MLLLSTAISLAAQSVPQFQSYALGALDRDGLAWLGFLGGVQNFVYVCSHFHDFAPRTPTDGRLSAAEMPQLAPPSHAWQMCMAASKPLPSQ
jgi:hypothetical protein